MINFEITKKIFIDIETVPTCSNFEELSEPMQNLWIKKSLAIKDNYDNDPNTMYAQKAGIYAEFAKIVCISIGTFVLQNDNWILYLKSIYNHNEKTLLKEFSLLIDTYQTKNKDVVFCGHNIKEFDLPFICRRLIINALPLPASLQLSNKKPWEIQHIDTLELWKFGDFKNFTSLALIAEVLGIPTPKDDIDGSQVANVYWQENDLNRISKYCLKDVLTTAKVYLHLNGMCDFKFEVKYL